MVPTLTEEKKELSNYENKFRRLVNELRQNRKIVFTGRGNEAKAVLIKEKTFEKMESYLETADILLNNPDILEELKKARKQVKRAKKITLSDLKEKLGI